MLHLNYDPIVLPLLDIYIGITIMVMVKTNSPCFSMVGKGGTTVVDRSEKNKKKHGEGGLCAITVALGNDS